MSTTESVESVHSIEAVEAVTIEVTLASLKSYAVADLFKVSKAALAEAEKRVKAGKLEPKAPKEKKATPKQLQKPTKWVRFVLEFSQNNGWEAFTVENKKSQEIIEMPASVINEEGVHVYPDGKKMILTHAMSLSKQYWAPKAKEGTRKDLYDLFEVEYNAHAEDEVEEEPVAVVEKPKMVRKTAEEKAAELAKQKAEREEAAKKKKEETARKRQETKDANAEEKKKAAAEKKAEKAPPKAAVKTTVKVVPAANGVKPGPKKKVVEEWTCPADGNVYPWTHKAQQYLRNAENQIWVAEEDGGCGDWAGLYLPSEDRIDDSAADPFADEE